MSRLRKIDRSILSGRTTHDDHDIPDLPMDTEDQEELIQRFEVNNNLRNKKYANMLSLTYLLFAGFCVMLASRSQNGEMALFVLMAQSTLCSMILTRYELMHNYTIFKMIFICVDNSRIQMINVIFIILIEWVGLQAHKGLYLFTFRQIPLVFLLITRTLKKWSSDMEREVNQLRKMKYKYKNA